MKEIINDIVNEINKKCPGLIIEIPGDNKIMVNSELTDLEVYIVFAEDGSCFTMTSNFPVSSEVFMRLAKLLMSVFWKSGYYVYGDKEDMEVFYVVPVEELGVETEFDRISDILEDYFLDTSVKVTKKKDTRLIVSGFEGAFVLRKLEKSGKAVIESGKDIALRLPFVNISRLFYQDVFEIIYTEGDN